MAGRADVLEVLKHWRGDIYVDAPPVRVVAVDCRVCLERVPAADIDDHPKRHLKMIYG